MKVTKQEATDARAMLLKFLKPGDTVYTVLRHVSRSGMLRIVSLYAIVDGAPQWLDGWASRLTGIALDRQREGLRMGGCGTDMGFEAVYNLSWALWPDGVPCIGDKCLSNDHSNGMTRTPDMPTERYTHKDSGYALNQRWM